MAKKQHSSRKKVHPAPTSKHFSHAIEYQRFIDILHRSATNREAARRIGISERTLRRWKSLGIPQQSADTYGRKLRYISSGLKAAEQRISPVQRPEPRSLYYYRTFGGVRTKYWIVDGAPYDELLYILLNECHKGIYSGFTLLLQLSAPFEGLWDGEAGYSAEDLRRLPTGERQYIRDTGSWVSVTMDQPFISTRIFPLVPGRCHPDEFSDTLNKYYGMKYAKIHEIRIKEFRRGEDEE